MSKITKPKVHVFYLAVPTQFLGRPLGVKVMIDSPLRLLEDIRR